MSVDKEYKEYMQFCHKYEDFISQTLEKIKVFNEEIPKNSTLYLHGNIEKLIEELNIVKQWIDNTSKISINDF